MTAKERKLLLNFPLASLLVVALMLIAGFAYDDWKFTQDLQKKALNYRSNDELSSHGLVQAISMSRFAFWQMWISFGALIVSAAALYGLSKSLSHTRSALNLTKNTSEAELTAYVAVTDARFSSDMTVSTIRLLNRGKTPVISYSIKMYIATRDDFEHDSESDIRHHLKDEYPVIFTSPEDDFEAHIFTQNEKVDQLKVFMKKLSLLKYYNDHLCNYNDEKCSITMSGIITYTNIFGNAYETIFSYRLDSLNAKDFLPVTTNLSIYRRVTT